MAEKDWESIWASAGSCLASLGLLMIASSQLRKDQVPFPLLWRIQRYLLLHNPDLRDFELISIDERIF